MVIIQGRNMPPWEQPWSAIVRIALYPLLLKSLMIRSIATCENGLVFFRDMIWNNGVFGQCVRFLFC
jgi:hypothetical protein